MCWILLDVARGCHKFNGFELSDLWPDSCRETCVDLACSRPCMPRGRVEEPSEPDSPGWHATSEALESLESLSCSKCSRFEPRLPQQGCHTQASRRHGLTAPISGPFGQGTREPHFCTHHQDEEKQEMSQQVPCIKGWRSGFGSCAGATSGSWTENLEFKDRAGLDWVKVSRSPMSTAEQRTDTGARHERYLGWATKRVAAPNSTGHLPYLSKVQPHEISVYILRGDMLGIPRSVSNNALAAGEYLGSSAKFQQSLPTPTGQNWARQEHGPHAN